MEYNKIIAVTGMPGLYELISSKNDGAIVRSLDDKTSKFVSSRIHSFSHLESIEIYTVRDNVNLVDILLAMQNSKTALPDTKDNGKVRSYFEAVYPDLDFERVYSSDMKKMVKWYEVLKNNGVEIKLSEPEPEAEEAPVEETPAKAAKSAKPKKEEAEKEAPKEEAPKKAAKKKEPTEEKEKPAKAAASKAAKPKKEEAKEEAPKKAAPKAASKAAPKKK
jgi:FtsZ-interacting cell division protein ZipA